MSPKISRPARVALLALALLALVWGVTGAGNPFGDNQGADLMSTSQAAPARAAAPAGPPPLDQKAPAQFKTATFALG